MATYVNPYIWRITLHDGTVLVRGDRFRGQTILSPDTRYPEGHEKAGKYVLRDEIQLLNLLPAHENSGWKPVMVTLGLGDVLVYGMTREEDTKVGVKRSMENGALQIIQTPGGALHCMAVQAGLVKPDGTRAVVWSFEDGRQIEHPGTYEEMITKGMIKDRQTSEREKADERARFREMARKARAAEEEKKDKK